MNVATLPTVATAHPLIDGLLTVAVILALGVLIVYTVFAPWWSTKTGVGVFALYWTVGLIIGHFAHESAFGQGPSWREAVLLAVLNCVLIWNGALIVYKQILRHRADHPKDTP